VPNSLELAKQVLSANQTVRFGIFGAIGAYPYFPPREFLNEFLMVGNDPCDQDGRMSSWPPFTVSSEEYREVLAWWVASHPGAAENRLDTACWDDWVQVVLNLWETGGVPPAPTADPISRPTDSNKNEDPDTA
jgi:hypothetical protein